MTLPPDPNELPRVDGDESIQMLGAAQVPLGQLVVVAEGVWLLRLPIDSMLEYVNVFLFAGSDGLTLIDTGMNTTESRQMLIDALASAPLKPWPLRRIIVTHFHPDHLGLVGLFNQEKVEVLASETCWTMSQRLLAASAQVPCQDEVLFMQRAGLAGMAFEAFRRRPANRYATLVAPLGERLGVLQHGQTLRFADRDWRVLLFHGHARDQVTLWSDHFAVLGDHLMPTISSNLSVPYTDPDSDLVGDWKAGCPVMELVATPAHIGLPGHQRPFMGLPQRIRQVVKSLDRQLDFVRQIATRPTTAWDCLERVYRRSLSQEERRILLPECVGFFNHLVKQGEALRSLSPQGAWIYQTLKPKRPLIQQLRPTKKSASPLVSPIEPAHDSPSKNSDS